MLVQTNIPYFHGRRPSEFANVKISAYHFFEPWGSTSYCRHWKFFRGACCRAHARSLEGQRWVVMHDMMSVCDCIIIISLFVLYVPSCSDSSGDVTNRQNVQQCFFISWDERNVNGKFHLLRFSWCWISFDGFNVLKLLQISSAQVETTNNLQKKH